MKTQAHVASSGSEQGFFGRLATVGALAVVIATGCSAAGDEGTGSPTSTPPGVTDVDQGGQPAPTPEQEEAARFSEAMENAAVRAKTVTPSKYGEDASPNQAPAPFKTTANVTCNPIVNGENSVTVNGRVRKFDVQLPQNLSTNAAILFEWHGFLQNSARFQNEIVYDPPAGRWRAFNPNAFPIPLITIAPRDQNLIPIWGLDWDIVSGERDFPFFEAMLTCVESQLKVDTRRVYSFGFSAGAVFTNLLAAAYPNLFAATISESGVWFNDRAQWSDIIIPFVGTVFMKWKWPAYNPSDRGAVMITHGGPNDFATVISLENANRKALPFLYNAGRDVTECTHEFGHTLEPDITEAMYYQFMWDNQLGGARPKALAAGLPTAEKPLFNSRCYFRPAP